MLMNGRWTRLVYDGRDSCSLVECKDHVYVNSSKNPRKKVLKCVYCDKPKKSGGVK